MKNNKTKKLIKKYEEDVKRTEKKINDETTHELLMITEVLFYEMEEKLKKMKIEDKIKFMKNIIYSESNVNYLYNEIELLINKILKLSYINEENK